MIIFFYSCKTVNTHTNGQVAFFESAILWTEIFSNSADSPSIGKYPKIAHSPGALRMHLCRKFQALKCIIRLLYNVYI